MSKESMKLALEALDNLMYWDNGKPDFDDARTAIKALEEALAKQGMVSPNIQSYLEKDNSQPVAWMDADGNVSDNNDYKCFPIPLYTTPPPCPTCEALARTVMLDQTSHDTTPQQRPWVGLTDEEKSELWEISRAALPRYATYASLVEAKIKEKNGL